MRQSKKNLSDFNRDARKLIKTNLSENYNDAEKSELDGFISKRKENGSHMGKELPSPLKFKKWLVELHEEPQAKERTINKELVAALTKQKETYLSGLNIRIKALQGNDPSATDLIKEEVKEVNASPDYFAELMRKESHNQ